MPARRRRCAPGARSSTRRSRIAADHLSLYQLTIEPETPFFRLQEAGKLDSPRSGARRRVLRADAGDHRGARPSRLRDLQPRRARRGVAPQPHLLALPRLCRRRPRRARPAAPSTGAKRATMSEKHPERWLEKVERDGHGLVVDETLSLEEAADEMLLMGLRLREGVPPERYSTMSGRDFSPARLRFLREHGFIEDRAARGGSAPRATAGWCSIPSSPTSPPEQAEPLRFRPDLRASRKCRRPRPAAGEPIGEHSCVCSFAPSSSARSSPPRPAAMAFAMAVGKAQHAGEPSARDRHGPRLRDHHRYRRHARRRLAHRRERCLRQRAEAS